MNSWTNYFKQNAHRGLSMKELRNRYLYREQVGGNVGLSPELKQKLEILYTNPLPNWLNNLTWYQLLYDQDVAGILGLEPTIEELELDELYSPESTDDYDDLLDTIKQVPDDEIAHTLHNSLSYWNEQLDDAKEEHEGLEIGRAHV